MLMKELISSCSHAPIAEAAVISIGASFQRRVARAARRDDVSVGEFAARAVRNFRAKAREQDWRDLAAICAGEDMPILRGLHHILEMAIEDGEAEPAPWQIASASSGGRRSCCA